MKVVGFAGYSGSGKTTLIEQLIPLLRARGQRVSVVKHAHHRFDIDHPGKDSWRHRQAGAFEVVVASDRRLALVREFEQPREPSVHDLVAELDPGVDWVLVEGLKEADVPKVEVWRAPSSDYAERPMRHAQDPWVVAIATDCADLLNRIPCAATPATLSATDPATGPATVPQALPVFDVSQPQPLADWLLAQAHRFDYVLRPAPRLPTHSQEPS